jgi:CTP synthase (UTP-ammonia lyase)
MHSEIRVGLLGEFKPQQPTHLAIPRALEAAAEGHVECIWVPTDSVGNGKSLAEFDGIWCVPGMPYRSPAGALEGIRYARLSRTPFLGTSAGFQYALIEFARNALGMSQAEHQKHDPQAALPLIAPLDAALLGVKARVHLRDGTLLRKAYGAPHSIEEYHCGFGLNPRYRRWMASALTFAAVDDHDEIRAVELEDHPFFVATLFMPELNPGSPLVKAFANAAIQRHNRMAARMAS